jgi:hypothetical protein
MTSYETLADRARRLVPDTRDWPRLAPYERKGILYSEVVFLLACLEGTRFNRLIESGRARGQSTLLLSLALPEHQLISIEIDPDSPDVPVAEERLRDRPNVTLAYGDARILMPKLIETGDVALIDGPKGFRSVRLALSLLGTGKVSGVFVHDLAVGTHERRFIDANLPEARFSDSRELAQVTNEADSSLVDVIPPHQRLEGFDGPFGYGFSLMYLPYRPDRRYRRLQRKAEVVDLLSRTVLRKKRTHAACASS